MARAEKEADDLRRVDKTRKMENTRLRAEIDQLEVTHLCQIHVGDS
jgi:hypothetical protein